MSDKTRSLSVRYLVPIALVAACSGDPTPPDPGPTGPFDLSGSWTWTAQGRNEELNGTCTASGDLLINQSGVVVSGLLANAVALCSAGRDNLTFDPGGDFTGGLVSSNTFTYDDGTCRFTGTISGNPPTKVEGPGSCNLDPSRGAFPDQAILVTGTWEMHR